MIDDFCLTFEVPPLPPELDAYHNGNTDSHGNADRHGSADCHGGNGKQTHRRMIEIIDLARAIESGN